MTQKTKAELDTFFADNATGLITPARLRDFVDSCKPSYVGLHFDDPGTPTTIATPATFVKAANTSTLHGANRFSMPADNRIRYDGVAAGAVAAVIATLSFTCAANNQVLAFALAVNGVISEPSIIRSKLTTGTDVKAVTITAHPELTAGDYIEVWVANDTSAANITIEHGHVQALAFLA